MGEKLAELSIPIGMHELALLVITFEEAIDRARCCKYGSTVDQGHLVGGVKTRRTPAPPLYDRRLGQRQLALVLHAEAADMNEVFLIGAQIIERLEKTAEVSVSIGIGRHCATIEELPRAYEEASEALRFRLLHGRGQVIFIEDVTLSQEDVTDAVFPKKHEEVFTGYVKLGDAEQAKRMNSGMIASCSAQRNRMHYAQLQFVFFKIITIVLQTLQHLGADITRLVKLDNNPFRELMALESMEQIQGWFDGASAKRQADGVGR